MAHPKGGARNIRRNQEAAVLIIGGRARTLWRTSFTRFAYSAGRLGAFLSRHRFLFAALALVCGVSRVCLGPSGVVPGPSWGSHGAFAVVVGPLALPWAAVLEQNGAVLD